MNENKQEPRKMTNYEKIKNMNVDEMAELLVECEFEGYRGSSITTRLPNGHHMDMQEWLESEVTEEC